MLALMIPHAGVPIPGFVHVSKSRLSARTMATNLHMYECTQHQQLGTTYIKRRRICQASGCTKDPCYARSNEPYPQFCSKHSHVGMIYIRRQRRVCQKDGCAKSPCYAMPNEPRPRFCSKHSQTGMVNIASRRCLAPGCNAFNPKYGVPNVPGRYCTRHKQPNMVTFGTKDKEPMEPYTHHSPFAKEPLLRTYSSLYPSLD